ncbi:hypothetical protein [Mucilaginibacter jinjuensis]|uniref:PE-PGRS family protein n=1 Tax=Mucilaginibacter jinjuensis TaxID=1176721 RepID=A0ABY7T515_9SPHI|nr:hypothetical protein [Mucilaginibacter jinjuensis]WCT10342.1 hypothetical protein PQO05_16525 [Mucilaginibacter jinjuensis]
MASFFSCKKSGQSDTPAKDTIATTVPPVTVNFATPTYDPSALDTTKLFATVPVVHNLARTDLLEISGVAASRVNAGILYIHNDSDNAAQVYLTDANGADRGTLSLSSVGNRDWEDIAVGPGPDATKNYIYVGDIGDNDAKYSSVFVYRFPEPNLTGAASPYVATIPTVDAIQLKYPDGPRNAETLMVDPLTKDIYIVSKESNVAKVYVARYPQSTTSVTTLSPVAKLFFNKATGGDISPDGTEMLLRSNDLIWYWKLAAGTTISAGFLNKPQHAPYANNEPQGEGVGFAADGSGYFTDTEIKGYTGKLATMSFYKRN